MRRPVAQLHPAGRAIARVRGRTRRGRGTPPGSRGGFVLPVALLLLLATTLLAHALWSLARVEGMIAAARRARIVAEYEATASLATAVQAAGGSAAGAGGPGEVGSGGGTGGVETGGAGGAAGSPAGTVVVELVQRSDALQEWVATGPGGVELVALRVTPTTESVLHEFGALLRVGGWIDPETRSRILPADPGSCGVGGVPTEALWPPREPTLAGFSLAELRSRLPVLPSRVEVLPDSGVVVSGATAGSVSLHGEGSVVVVADRVLLEAGAQLDGVVITTGELRLRAGARFRGAALVGGALLIEESGALTPSACPPIGALPATGLLAPRAVGPGGWPRR